MLRRTFQFSLAAASLARAGAPAAGRMLWAGSSSTYYHDMPDQVAQALNRFGRTNRVWQSELVGRSGDSIQVYLKPGTFTPQYGLKEGQTFLDKIRDERFDFVVLQVVTNFLTGKGGPELEDALDTYVQAIRKAGGEPVWYEMGWGLDAENERGRELAMASARRNKVKYYAPCSTVWKRIREQRPDLELHNLPDRSHPGTLGHYLNLCTLFAAMSGRNPEVLPPTYPWWSNLTDDEKKQADAKEAALTNPTEYQRKLPQWLRRRSVMAHEKTLDPDTAALFRRTAWECWRESDRRLKS